MIAGIPKEAFIFLTVIGLVLIVPLITDQIIQYRFARKKLEIIDLSKDLSKEDRKNYEIYKPSPTSSLYRSLMTFGIILLIASMLMYILGIISSYVQPLSETLDSFNNYMKTTNQTKYDNQTAIINNLIVSHNASMDAMSSTMLSIIKDVATILGGAVSAIVGFFFGNKAATDSVPEKPTPQEKDDTGKADKEKADKEKPDKEKPDKEKADKEKPDKEKPDKEKADKEKADKEKPDKEKADKEKADKEKADKDKSITTNDKIESIDD